MTLCINPQCQKPDNPDRHRFCQSCGSELLLGGKYRVTKLLSNKGGFGKTYEAEDQNGQPLVVKVLVNDHPKAIELFRQESEVLMMLHHPGIPKGLGHFSYFPRDNSSPLECLVMEKIEGQDLEDYQKQRNLQPISEALALDWLSQLTDILHEVHARNFFHRDIKPSNIILRPNGQLALIDFGAVRQVTATIIAGGQNTGIYTPGYAPPEQERVCGAPIGFFCPGPYFCFFIDGQNP